MSKVLWKETGLPDNYVPDTFLSSLRRNTHVKPYRYWLIVEDTSVLALNSSLVQIFVVTFMAIYSGRLLASSACAAASVHTLIIASFWARLDKGSRLLQTVKAILLLTALVRALSPVFLSLTRSTSSDSIWHVTAWLCALYMVLASLSMAHNRHTRVMATNTALSATIVLASRLAAPDQVFYFLMFNFQTFVLLPSAGLWIFRTSRFFYFVFLASTILVANSLTVIYVGQKMALACFLVQMGIMFGIPTLFINVQKYKDQISGPWDPAKPIIDVK